MQVMPATYEELRARYGLGDDRYHPRNNIMAGTAYIREMYDRYGYPAFLAAYNAGPGRLEGHLYGGRSLPAETTAHLAAVVPRLAGTAEAWGPLATYASIVPERSAEDPNPSALAALSSPAATPSAPPASQPPTLSSPPTMPGRAAWRVISTAADRCRPRRRPIWLPWCRASPARPRPGGRWPPMRASFPSGPRKI